MVEVWGDSHMTRLPFWYFFPSICTINNSNAGETFSSFSAIYSDSNCSKAIVCLGINDFLQNQGLSPDELLSYFEKNYQTLLSDIEVDYENSYIIGMIPYTKTFEESNNLQKTHLLDVINRELELKCEQTLTVRYIDCSEYLCDKYGYLKSEYSSDGLHLNNTGNALLSKAIKNAFTF
jgi:lysophospholipase L1-like esterase